MTGRNNRRVELVSRPESTTLLRSIFGLFFDLSNGSNERLLSDNVQLDTYWVVRVVDTKIRKADQNFLADYFDFPQSQCVEAETSSITSEKWKWSPEEVRSITAKQDLGSTKYRNEDIQRKRLHHPLMCIHITSLTLISVNELRNGWGMPHFHYWHSQQFSIFLALLILQSSSLGDAQPQLRNLWNELGEARRKWRSKRDLTILGVTVLLGVATGGPGIGAGVVAGSGSVVSDELADSDAHAAIKKLKDEFERIRDCSEWLEAR
jgi:hypothetical protein